MIKQVYLRKPKPEDASPAFDLCAKFHMETAAKHGFRFNQDDAYLVMEYFAGGGGKCIVAQSGTDLVGILAGVVQPYSLCTSQRIFREALWYVKPEYRGVSGRILYDEMMQELRDDGVEMAFFANQENYMKEPMEHFYVRNGFSLLETHWVKVL